MSLLSGISEFFGLDIGTTAARLVQLRGSGANKSLVKYAYVPLDSTTVLSDAPADQQKLAKTIQSLCEQAQLTTKNVAVGIPSQKVFTTVVDIDRLDPHELAKTIRYQADALIPTPIKESKIDWALLGDSPVDRTKMEVLLSSVPNKFIEQRLEMLESIGLNVIALEPDNLAISRALLPPTSTEPTMVLDVGNKNTDLAIDLNGAPRLTRAIPTGTEALVRSAAQNLNIETEQAQQFVFKFGLNKEKLEGQVYQAIIGTVDLLVAEIEKSIKFFQARYTNVHLSRIVVTGGASAIPDFPLYIANKFGINVEIGNSWRNVSISQGNQNELMGVSNHFAVAVGLAERDE